MEEKLTVGFTAQKEEMDKKMTEFKAALQSLEIRTPDHTNPISTEVSKQIEDNNRMQAAKFVSIGKVNLTELDVKNLTTKHKVLVNNTRTYATARIFKHMDRIYTTFVKQLVKQKFVLWSSTTKTDRQATWNQRIFSAQQFVRSLERFFSCPSKRKRFEKLKKHVIWSKNYFACLKNKG